MAGSVDWMELAPRGSWGVSDPSTVGEGVESVTGILLFGTVIGEQGGVVRGPQAQFILERREGFKSLVGLHAWSHVGEQVIHFLADKRCMVIHEAFEEKGGGSRGKQTGSKNSVFE